MKFINVVVTKYDVKEREIYDACVERVSKYLTSREERLSNRSHHHD